MNSPEIPNRCPKCGADFLRDSNGAIQFHCGSVSKRGYIGVKIETAICTGRQRDQLAERVRVFEAALSDPAAVWANMLRGTIAMPPHIPELEGRLTDAHVRIQELEAALDLVIPNCDYLHHEKKHRHSSHEPCPVLEIVMKAKGLK